MQSCAARRCLRISFALVIAVASLASLVAVRPAQAATFTIPDGDVAALITAMTTANANGVPDIIELAAGGTYTLTTAVETGAEPTGLPLITSEMTINGNGATITRSTTVGTPEFHIMEVRAGGNLTLDRVTISNGRSNGYFGGGIYVQESTLRLTNSTLINNTANEGGGINAHVLSTVTIINSTISGNTGHSIGGGIASWNQLTIINSTITGNRSSGIGGGICNFGNMTIINSTISENTVESIYGGGGIYSVSSTATLTNTIVAGNTATPDPDILGSVTGTNNLIGDGAGMSGLTNGVDGNLVGTAIAPIDPLLDTLADNGGSTQTMALLTNSPAIDAGTNNDQTPTADQRGTPRPQGTANDIGAFELKVSVTHAELCTMTQSLARNPMLARATCASLMLAQRADQAGNERMEQLALTMYRLQIRIGIVFRAISAADGQQLLDWSYRIE